jgi:hypothetical protein
VVLFLRRNGVDAMLAYLTGIVAAILGSTHWLARPHLFTLLGLSVLLFVLEGRRRTTLFLTLPLFAVWSNFHPGFVIGLAILAAYVTGDLAEALLDESHRREWRARARYHASAIGLGIVGACFNPQGPGFFLRIARILGDATVVGTNEFMSPDFHSVSGGVFLVLIVVITGTFALSRTRPLMTHLAVVLLMLSAALYSARNIAIFGVTAVPLLAVSWNGMWRGLAARRLVHIRSVFEAGEAIALPGRWLLVPAALMFLLGGTGGRLAGAQIVADGFDPEVFPVAAVERARAAGLTGNLYNEFTWGGYVLYAWPDGKIYIDGMTDFFGGEITREYLSVFYLQEGWERTLRRRDIELVLLKPDAPLLHALGREPGWTRWYGDSVAVLLRRSTPDSAGVQ